MSEITITMRLFGPLRAYGERVIFKIAAGSGVHEIKEMLARTLKTADARLIADSALANDNEIITDMVFTKDSELAILPPVCGG